MRKVLCLEDDPEDLSMIRECLAGIRGPMSGELYQVDVACSVRVALRMMEGERFDLFFVDYYLGTGELGCDFIEQLIAGQSQAGILLLSGVDMLRLDLRAIEWVSEGQVTFLHKEELSAATLETAVSNLLNS